MFLSPFRASLITLVAYALAVSATPGLTVKASVPNVQVDGLEYLKVTATVTNTGDETLKLLNDPRGVLNPFPEDTFSITDGTGSRPSFNGARVSHELVAGETGILTLSVSTLRLNTAQHTPSALTIPALLPFSLLVLPSISPMIVSAIDRSRFGHRLINLIISIHYIQLYSNWYRGLLYRTIEPLHLCRCRWHPQEPPRQSPGSCWR